MAMIECKDVSKWYGSFQVLTNCTTKSKKARSIVVCGPSGSGKSTLIKCVNALEPFQKGAVTVDGVSVGAPKTNLPKLRARVGMVFQHFELFPHLTIIDNLTMAQIKVLGRDKEEASERGMKLLDRVGLTVAGGKVSRATVGRPATAGRDCASTVDGSDLHAVRRADVRARSRDDQRSAGRDGAAGEGGHDDDGRHARDGVCAQGGAIA